MATDSHYRELKEQAAVFRSVVVRAGPDVAVPTCPDQDVRWLVRHLARVYETASLAMDVGADAERPRATTVPENFDAALAAWDQRLAELETKLAGADQDRAVWSFFTGGTPRSWTRRLAHETAVHRLDAEHAAASLGPDHVRELMFGSRFAADGIDEMLTVLLPGTREWSRERGRGKVLYHAADAGRAWLVTFRAGEFPAVGSPQDAALGTNEVDTTVAGTADAVYRRVWGRPSNAVVTGDTQLAELVHGR